MSVRIFDFYTGLPVTGVPFGRQWPKFREDFNALGPIVRGAYIDENINNESEHDLSGLAIGELDFRNRYRTFYDKSSNEFIIQYNTGTEAVPVWTTRLTIRDTDGRVTVNSPGGFTSVGGFYNLGGLDVDVTVAGGASFSNVGTLRFSSQSGFYLTPDSTGRPIVNIDAAAASGTITDGANLGAGGQVFKNKNASTLNFRSIVGGTNVTVTQNANDLTIAASDTGEVNLASNLGSGQGVWFDKQGVTLRFKSLVGGRNTTLTSDNNEITINSETNFYGIIFKESRLNGSVQRDDTLVVDSAAFYLQQLGNTGKPLLGLQPRIELNQLDMNGFISILETTEPPTPNSSHGALWAGDDHGHTVLNFKDDDGQNVQVSRDNVLVARNITGSTLNAGSAVYISGVTGDAPQISLAKADSSNTMPAVGILLRSVSNNGFGIVLTQGVLTGVNLSAFSSGDNVWVSPSSAGALTATEPSHPNFHQQVGVVIRNTSNGILLVNMDHADGDDSGTNLSSFSIGTNAASSIVLSPNSSSQRTATFQDKSGTVAYLNDIGPAFYGLIIKETETGGYNFRKDTLNFDSSYFYIDGDSKQKPVISLKNFSDIETFNSAIQRHNAIINGNFEIWQRGTTFDKIDNFKYTADRWQFFYVGGTGVDGIDVDRSSFVPSSTVGTGTSTFSFQITVDTADASIGSNECYAFAQGIEGFNAQQFGFGTPDNKDLTLSFWVRSSLIGTYCVFFRNNQQSSTGRVYVAEYTINSTNIWEQKIITLRADREGSWALNQNLGILVGFVLACGSGLNVAANTWTTSGAFATSNQVNFLATAGNAIRFSRIQLEKGVRASEFERRLVGEELNLCQRYYAKTFPQSTVPANGSGTNGAVIGKGIVSGGINVEPLVNWFMPNTMRATPTITLFNTRSGGAPGQWQNGPSADSANARVISNSDTVTVIDNTGVQLTGTNQAFIQITAEAEF